MKLCWRVLVSFWDVDVVIIRIVLFVYNISLFLVIVDDKLFMYILNRSGFKIFFCGIFRLMVWVFDNFLFIYMYWCLFVRYDLNYFRFLVDSFICFSFFRSILWLIELNVLDILRNSILVIFCLFIVLRIKLFSWFIVCVVLWLCLNLYWCLYNKFKWFR